MDIIQLVADYTGCSESDLEFTGGIPTGVGEEFWVVNKETSQSWYVCVDQGDVTIEME